MTTLLTCSSREARVDLWHRMFSWKELPSCTVHLVQVLVLSNRSMTRYNPNLSVMFIASSEIYFGPSASINSASISSGNGFHVDHAVLFPCPAKLCTVSQPVKAWHIGRAHDTSGPRLFGGLSGSENSFQMLATVHSQDYNISLNCANEHLVVAMLLSVW